MDNKEKSKLIEKYHTLTEDLEKTIAEIYPDNVKIDAQKAELKQAKKTTIEIGEQIAELEKGIDFYGNKDKVKEMVDFVNNTPYILFPDRPSILLDRDSALFLRSAGNFEPSKEDAFNNLIKTEENKFVDKLDLKWERLTDSELEKIFKYYNSLYNEGNRLGIDLIGKVDIKKVLNIMSDVISTTSSSLSDYIDSNHFSFLFEVSKLAKTGDIKSDKSSLVLKHKFKFNNKVKELGTKYDELTAAEYITGLADDGFEIADKNIIRVAQAYCKKLQLTDELNEIEAELKSAKIKKPKPRKKTKKQAVKETLAKGFDFNFSTEELDVFAYRTEVSRLIQDSIIELRSFTADNAEEQIEFINSIKENFNKLNFHNAAEEEKSRIQTAVNGELNILDCSPEELIKQLISFQQEIESLTNDAAQVSFTGKGLNTLASVLQSQIPALESALSYIEYRKAGYLSKYDIIAENRDTILSLVKKQVEHINRFSGFLETGRKKFLSDAAKEQTDISITDRLWAMLRELRVQLLVSYSELLTVSISGKFDIEKMEDILKELQVFEKTLDKTFSTKLQNKNLTLLTLQSEIDAALEQEYVKFRKTLHTIKYEI